MLDIYVCEDNRSQLDLISTYISNYCIIRNEDARLALSTPEPDEILEHYKTSGNPALFFLDINLNAQMNGIGLASEIRKLGKKATIVFLTVHSEMVFLTFQYKVEALDFIVKGTAEDIKERVRSCIEATIANNFVKDKAKILQIKVYDKVMFLDMDEIVSIETTTMRNKLRLYTIERRLEFNGELKSLEAMLDERFIRCHRSCIINKERIVSIDNKKNTVKMINDHVCPISRNGKRKIIG